VLPDSIIDDGVVVIEGEKIASVGPVSEAQLPEGGGLPPENVNAVIMPGFIDLHNHGGGGASFPDATTMAEVETAVNAHLRGGTTTMLASLVTADPPTLEARMALLVQAAEKGTIAGIHIEGPFLSYKRRGAQSPDYLREGDPELVAQLVADGKGWLRTMTVAPEVKGVTGPGGAAEALTNAGVIPTLGHTDCTCEQAEALIAQVSPALAAKGLRMTANHLFNGMPPLHHRTPGPVAACIAAAARGDMVVEMIGDNVHLDPATVRTFFPLANGNAAFITDAMAAAGMPDGNYQLGPMAVEVHEGVARLAPGPGDDPNAERAIAGGTARLIDVVQRANAAGIPLEKAVRAASLVPASVLGFQDRGSLEAGKRADIVVTDNKLNPLAVYKAGKLVTSADFC
jgi:N-acetylglucosamine-6-phosphate deacetylase